MLWTMILIFMAGIILDGLAALYVRYVAIKKPIHAALVSGIITMTNVGILVTIVQHAETLGMFGAVAMAGGSSVGTFLAIKRA